MNILSKVHLIPMGLVPECFAATTNAGAVVGVHAAVDEGGVNPNFLIDFPVDKM